MKLVLSILCLVTVSLYAGVVDDDMIFRRGDANHNGTVALSDAQLILNWYYSGGPAPPCMNEADANHSGTVDGTDGVYLLNWLFSGGPAPPSPGPFATNCSRSSAPYISCLSGCP